MENLKRETRVYTEKSTDSEMFLLDEESYRIKNQKKEE